MHCFQNWDESRFREEFDHAFGQISSSPWSSFVALTGMMRTGRQPQVQLYFSKPPPHIAEAYDAGGPKDYLLEVKAREQLSAHDVERVHDASRVAMKKIGGFGE